MTRNELEQITKWLEANANSSKFRNVYEMLERFKLEFNHLLKEEQTFNSGVWIYTADSNDEDGIVKVIVNTLWSTIVSSVTTTRFTYFNNHLCTPA